jgi:diguanylate cyclase (GGDEF)-like protein
MKIIYKLTLVFLIVTILYGITAYLSIKSSKDALEKSIGDSSVMIAQEIMDKIDRAIFYRIEDMQAYARDIELQELIAKSNKKFDAMDDPQAYIDKKDKEWIATPKDTVSPFMLKLINTDLFIELKEKSEFYEEKYGYKVYPEIFVTNKYGANTGQTGRTTDYYQADEKWWQETKANGLHVRDVAYDESSKAYALGIGIRVDDKQGDFAGVILVFLNIKEIVRTVNEADPRSQLNLEMHRAHGHENHTDVHIELLNKDGMFIHSTGNEGHKPFTNISESLFSKVKNTDIGGFFWEDGDRQGAEDELFAHAHSRGYRDFAGLGWILLLEGSKKELFAPARALRTSLINISLVLTAIIFLVGLWIAIYVSKPIKKLEMAIDKIGMGELDTTIDIKSGDELGQLARSFNRMTKDLKNITASRDELNKEMLQRSMAEEKLQHMAYYDQLTGLPNRANFLAYAKRMLKRSKFRTDYLFAVLFLDLDRFKLINDSLGHAIGDQLLAEVARRLDECVRATDRIARVAGSDSVARFGGDEFAIFLNDVKDISIATRVAERTKIALQKPFYIDGHELYTSASIGIALSASGYNNAEDILRDADSAMYRAKSSGRGCFKIYDDAMHKTVTERLQLESELRIAVEREEFMVYYQPIVSVKDGRIAAAEALLRWNHPQHGIISPMEFIPIAEETGLISDIGEWILREACRQNKEWLDSGYQPLLMKVNISSRQIKEDNFSKLVMRVVEETGMPSQFLDLEITESIAMEKRSIKILNQLTDVGIKTSIDDFGTGYSSLGALRKFPINTIKIDRAFIKDIKYDVNAEAIVNAIIAMARSLKMEIIAEGVETAEQLALLKSEKCELMQGYLFSPPVSDIEFTKLLEKEKNGYLLIQRHSELTA